MSIGFLFWLIWLLWALFGFWGNWPGYTAPPFARPGWVLLTLVLFFLVGWRVFGFILQG